MPTLTPHICFSQSSSVITTTQNYQENGRLPYGSLLVRFVTGPRIRPGEADHLARKTAHGTGHERQVPGGPVPKDHITGAAADPLSLASAVDRHRGSPFVSA